MKRALITGATGGIGSEVAVLLGERGFALTLVGRNRKTLITLQEKIGKKVPIDYLICDHTDKMQSFALEKYLSEHCFDLVINNAGFGLYGESHSLSLEKQREMIAVNVTALMSQTHIATRTMMKEGREGTIVNVSSLASFIPMPLMAVYGATKAFVTSYSEAVDYEVRPYGIRVLAFCPGMVATSFAEKAAQSENMGPLAHQMSPLKAAGELLGQVAAQQGVYLADGKARFLFYMGRLLPRPWLKKMIYKSIKKRI